LGLIQEHPSVITHFLANAESIKDIRKEIENRKPHLGKVRSSIDVPLSDECKGLLAFAADEAERLKRRPIGTEHLLLLGFLREEKCAATGILFRHGLRLDDARLEIERQGQNPPQQL
jgi:ATP-dependent Clp protease ATP-binding subunit ClpC